MKRISVKKAAEMLEVPPQAVRRMVQLGRFGEIINDSKYRNTYYITDVMVNDFRKGGNK